eukprot:464662-Rhodomonas_salina.2
MGRSMSLLFRISKLRSSGKYPRPFGSDVIKLSSSRRDWRHVSLDTVAGSSSSLFSRTSIVVSVNILPSEDGSPTSALPRAFNSARCSRRGSRSGSSISKLFSTDSDVRCVIPCAHLSRRGFCSSQDPPGRGRPLPVCGVKGQIQHGNRHRCVHLAY